MQALFAILLLLPQQTEIRISGATRYKQHSLVRLQAEGADGKAAILWRVHPSRSVDRATTSRNLLQFAAPPGRYQVELLVISNRDGGLDVQEVFTEIEIEGGAESPPPEGKLDPVGAIGRIQFGSAGCTATVVGPRRADGKWDVLTAAHCVSGVGARGRLTMKDGRSLDIKVVVHQRTPDVAWCVTEQAVADMPHAMLADRNPEPDTGIWHMGYGVDKPGNREEGIITEGENRDGQLRMLLSVSSGDSGGGIFRKDTNELVSVVCCTSGIGRRASMWGCSTEAARRARPSSTSKLDGWNPVPIPICWKPLPIPVRSEGGD